MIKPDDIFLYLGGKALVQTGTPVWRTRPRYKGGEDLRETISIDTDGYARGRISKAYVNYPGGAEPRVDWWDLDADDVLETPAIVVESARTNVLTQSSNLADSGSPWLNNGNFTIASATSIITGQTAYSHQNDNGAADRARVQSVTTLTGSPESMWCIVENTDALVSAIGLWDASGAAFVAEVQLTWADGTLAVTDGTAPSTYVKKLADAGPNGGAVYWFGFTATGTGSNNRSFYVYPSGITQNALTAIVHHVQHEESPYPSLTPVVTAGSSVARSKDALSVPWYGPMHTFQVYVKFIEYGAINDTAARVFHVGSTTGARLILQTHTSGGEYQAVLTNATTSTFTGTGGSTPVHGDEVEYLFTVNANGSISGTQAINGTADSALTGAAITPAAAWSSQTMYLSDDNDVNPGGHGHIALIATRGTSYTLAEFRELSEA